MITYRPSSRSDGYRKRSQTGFGGYDHRLGASDGAIFDMKNMGSDYYPLASPRAPRYIHDFIKVGTPKGLTGYGNIYYVDGKNLYDNDDSVGELNDATSKTFAFLGKVLVILPDKMYYDTDTGDFGSLEAEWSGMVAFADGKFAGEQAKACRIVSRSDDNVEFPFKVGDAVTISGAEEEANNTTLIIREINKDKTSICFYENSFDLGLPEDEAAEDGAESESQTITIKRSVPDMDFICENENRLFGCKGDTIYATKLGDPFNWNVYDGLADDSFSVDTGSAGNFTACCSYGGYAIFFKEDRIYKLYGDKPSNFKLMSSATLGVMEGADKSVAVAGEALYYQSRVGIMVYTGGIPSCISEVFGDVCYQKGVGGSDGLRYYVSLQDRANGKWSLFCYDTRYKTWHREDETRVIGFAYNNGLWMLTGEGKMLIIGAHPLLASGMCKIEENVPSMMEFYDITESNADKKYVNSLQLRMMLSENASVTVSMSFDGGEYEVVDTITDTGKTSYVVTCRLHRCDYYRIRLEGVGDYKLFALTREYSGGSER